jgi:hypothetical protein
LVIVTRNLESLLNELGAARAAGVFPTADAAPASFPWQTQSAQTQSAQTRPAKLTHRGLRWVRLAIPVAAAAALAFIFVGPGTSRKDLAHLTADAPTPVTTAFVSANGARANDCNGDGVVNGLDIECYVRHHAEESRAPELQTEAFTRRLLGI